jgi:hypothetical protein
MAWVKTYFMLLLTKNKSVFCSFRQRGILIGCWERFYNVITNYVHKNIMIIVSFANSQSGYQNFLLCNQNKDALTPQETTAYFSLDFNIIL